jgi:hypothetical protein
MNVELEIVHQGRSAEELYATLLADSAVKIEGVQFNIRRGIEFRGVPVPDTAVLVAIVGAVNAVVTALVNGLFKLGEQRVRPDRIIIEGTDGGRIEVPAGTPENEIARLIALAQGFQPKRIQLLSS